MPDSLLHRPIDQRVREFKYRFAQTAVFGAPVLALQAFGHQLGGAEADRYVAIFQAALCGWILYVAAAGMLFEGVVLFVERSRVSADASVAILVVICWLIGLASIFRGRSRCFAIVVIGLLIWTAARWAWLARCAARQPV